MEDLAVKDIDTISNILPYDYVRDRMIIALDSDNECNVYSPNIVNIKTYQELSRFLNKPVLKKFSSNSHELYPKKIEFFQLENFSIICRSIE